MSGQKIEPIGNCKEKQQTYREHKGRYKLAMKEGFYFEALLIDYALLEDRLRAMLFHMGFLTERTSFGIWKKKSDCLHEIVSAYKNEDENDRLGITNITGKAKIVRCILKWTAYTEGGYQQDKHLSALKSQCEGLDVGGLLSTLDELQDWCAYRNELIHGLMNKKLESLKIELTERTEQGMRMSNFIDTQVKLLKKGNKIRKSANLQNH